MRWDEIRVWYWGTVINRIKFQSGLFTFTYLTQIIEPVTQTIHPQNPGSLLWSSVWGLEAQPHSHSAIISLLVFGHLCHLLRQLADPVLYIFRGVVISLPCKPKLHTIGPFTDVRTLVEQIIRVIKRPPQATNARLAPLVSQGRFFFDGVEPNDEHGVIKYDRTEELNSRVTLMKLPKAIWHSYHITSHKLKRRSKI